MKVREGDYLSLLLYIMYLIISKIVNIVQNILYAMISMTSFLLLQFVVLFVFLMAHELQPFSQTQINIFENIFADTYNQPLVSTVNEL